MAKRSKVSKTCCRVLGPRSWGNIAPVCFFGRSPKQLSNGMLFWVASWKSKNAILLGKSYIFAMFWRSSIPKYSFSLVKASFLQFGDEIWRFQPWNWSLRVKNIVFIGIFFCKDSCWKTRFWFKFVAWRLVFGYSSENIVFTR